MSPVAAVGSRRIPIAALLTAQAISVTGNRIALVAIPWFVLQTTGSAAQTGIAAAMNTIPAIIAGLLAGPLIERMGYRLTSVGADLASGLTIAAIPILHLTGTLTYPILLVLVFTGAALDAPGETARRALLPDVAEHGGVSIDRASSLHETTYRTTQLLGAPIGGLLIAAIGAAEAMLVNAATFAASAMLVGWLARLPRTTPAGASDQSREPGGYFAELGQAWAWLLSHPLLRSVVAVFVGANILEAGLVQVLLPILSERVYDNAVILGLLVGAIGGGALVGVAMHAFIADRYTRRRILVPALAIAGAPKYLLLAVFPPAPLAIAGMLVLSIAMGPINPISGAIEYELVPRAMRGRVFGLFAVSFIGAASVGSLGAGALVEVLGLRSTLLIGGALYALVAAIPAMHPTWRDLDNLVAAPPA